MPGILEADSAITNESCPRSASLVLLNRTKDRHEGGVIRSGSASKVRRDGVRCVTIARHRHPGSTFIARCAFEGNDWDLSNDTACFFAVRKGRRKGNQPIPKGHT